MNEGTIFNQRQKRQKLVMKLFSLRRRNWKPNPNSKKPNKFSCIIMEDKENQLK